MVSDSARTYKAWAKTEVCDLGILWKFCGGLCVRRSAQCREHKELEEVPVRGSPQSVATLSLKRGWNKVQSRCAKEPQEEEKVSNSTWAHPERCMRNRETFWAGET